MATAAVFIALGGTAYAAATIGSSQVIDNSLLSDDLKNNAVVGSVDVSNDNMPNSLTGSDVRDLTGNDLAAGSIGAREVADTSEWIQRSTTVPPGGGVRGHRTLPERRQGPERRGRLFLPLWRYLSD